MNEVAVQRLMIEVQVMKIGGCLYDLESAISQ
jgi:hypothetical protein